MRFVCTDESHQLPEDDEKKKKGKLPSCNNVFLVEISLFTKFILNYKEKQSSVVVFFIC